MSDVMAKNSVKLTERRRNRRTGREQRYERLINVGIALSAERDHDRLMEMILLEAKELCKADGGTLYLRTEDDRLKFAIMRTDSLGIAMGGTTGKEIPFPPLHIFDPATGAPNHKNVATYVAATGNSVNIPDAYEAENFDFSGTRKFDQGTGYRSKSFLTVPLKNHHGRVIGILQLLNAKDPRVEGVAPFDSEVQPVVEALASQAAIAMENQMLIDAQKRLLDSFIEVMASAIDAKSPYTGGHCQRVPELTRLLAEAASADDSEPFRSFSMNADEKYELNIAALLHDCGKVTTPEYVVDKATKLETIYDRIHEIRTRFEVVKRDVEIECLRKLLGGAADPEAVQRERDEKLAAIDADFRFVAECNVGGEFMAPDKVERVKKIAGMTWKRTLSDRIGLGPLERYRLANYPEPTLPVVEPLLADKPQHRLPRDARTFRGDDPRFGFKLDMPVDQYNFGEIYNLCIPRGTLTEEERFKINEHTIQTIVMLEQLPFPNHMKRVPEYAGAHHEKLDGTGYPRKLTKEQMSIPARIMAVADIFEALTATDRPYKVAKKLSEAIRIMSFMAKDKHIDPDIFHLLLRSGVYQRYAERLLRPDQIDAVDVNQYLPKAG